MNTHIINHLHRVGDTVAYEDKSPTQTLKNTIENLASLKSPEGIGQVFFNTYSTELDSREHRYFLSFDLVIDDNETICTPQLEISIPSPQETTVHTVFEAKGIELNDVTESSIDEALVSLTNGAFEFFSVHSTTKEHEYKFLPTNTLQRTSIEQHAEKIEQIKQCYLNRDKDRTARIRIINDEIAYQTVKMQGGVELEWEIPLAEALCIYNSYESGKGALEKTRYTIDWADEGLKIEVDFFEGRLNPLVLIEIEVPSENYVIEQIPHWIGEDVSKQRAFKNAVLAYQGEFD